jgi:AAA+ ATPase superfamily predicted ATPase
MVVMGLAPTVMAQADESVDLDALYRQIDEAISLSPTYVAVREGQIADWRNRLNKEKDVEKSVQIAEELFRLYQPYKNDSALYYAERCIAIADSLRRPDLAGRYRSMMAYQCSDADMHTEAVELLRAVDKSTLDSVGLVNYYHAWMHIYGELGSYTQRHAMRLRYFGLQDAYRDSVLMVADEGSEEWLHLKVDILCARQLYQDALELNSKWLETVTDNTHESAYAAFYRSMVYNRLKNHDQTCYWMGKSALDDIRCAVMNQASLLFLAERLADDGDVSRAYRYAEFAKDCNLTFCPRLRTYQVDPVINVIEKNSQAKQARANRILIACVVIALLIIALIFVFYRSKRKDYGR